MNLHPLKMDKVELMTIYLFGQLNGHFKKRSIYMFINEYWRQRFPLFFIASQPIINDHLAIAQNLAISTEVRFSLFNKII